MIVDLNESPPEPSHFDICIIGAGVAGITIALELSKSNLKVALLEGGGTAYSTESQDLYKGFNIGKDYYSADTSRIRFLGGTSNHWGGNCRELQELDFKFREWVPNSGWPITKAELVKYYEKAADYCQIGNRGEFLASLESNDVAKIPKRSDEAKLFVTQYAPKTRDADSFKALSFGEAYRDKLGDCKNVTVYLNANVLRINESFNSNKIESVSVINFKEKAYSFRADNFVLAAGGIENAHLLLVSNGKHQAGLGNSSDCVGRYFMEHLSITLGHLVPSKKNLDYYDIYDRPTRRISKPSQDAIRKKAYLTFSESLLRKRKIGNTSVSIKRYHLPPSHRTAGYKSAKEFVTNILNGQAPAEFHFHLRNVLTGIDDVVDGLYWKYFEHDRPIPLYRVSVQTEQVPNSESRVVLSGEIDKFGVPKASLDWRLTEIDIRTIRDTALLAAREFGVADEGRMVITLPESDEDLANEIYGDWHHMGTTRMSDNAETGVVDKNCKVHDNDNLFIAGSSVFPTGGHSVPTLTIVALAARLANHLGALYDN